MTDNDLKHLSRLDLLELLISQEKENTKLQKKIEELTAQLTEREIRIQKAGTMAEAAILLNGVLEAADKAAAQYLENIKKRAGENAEKQPEQPAERQASKTETPRRRQKRKPRRSEEAVPELKEIAIPEETAQGDIVDDGNREKEQKEAGDKADITQES